MDKTIREIEREAAVDGWTNELRTTWLNLKNRVYPDGRPRKKLLGNVYLRKAIRFCKGKPVRDGIWRAKVDNTVKPFEFNDILVFKGLKKQNTSRTGAEFKSTKYDGAIVVMDIRDFSSAAKLMTRGILKGRFVWKAFASPPKQLVRLIEEI